MKLRSILLYFAAVMLLIFLPQAQGAALDAGFRAGAARFSAGGFELRDCFPGAVITVNQIHLPILVSGKPKLLAENKVQTFLGAGIERKYTWEHARHLTLVWTVTTLDSGDGVTLKTSIYNGSGEALSLSELAVIENGLVSLRNSDNGSNWFLSALSDSGQTGPLAALSNRAIHDYMGIYRSEDVGLTFGAVNNVEAGVLFQVRIVKGNFIIRGSSDASDVALDPGCWRDSQEIAILARPHRAAFSSLFQWVAATHGARTRSIIRDGADAKPIDLDLGEGSAVALNLGKTRLQNARAYAQARRNVLGENAFLRVASCAERGALGIADACLIASNAPSEWRTADNRGAFNRIAALGDVALVNGVWFFIDLGALSFDQKGSLTREETQTWLSIAGLSGSKFSIDELPTRSTNSIGNPDILAGAAPEKGWSFNGAIDPNHQRFGYVVRRAFGDFAALTIWNSADASADLSIGNAGLGEIGARFYIWSFWDERFHGIGGADYVCKNLSSHACKLLRLTPVNSDTNTPCLIGSTLHISMGAAEIADFGSDFKNVWIRLNRAGARQGKLFLIHPKPLQLSAAENCVVDSVRERSTGLWEITISSRDRSREQKIALSVIE
jgi:hypothetical protein